MTDYQKTFDIAANPSDVFKALTQGITKWWTTGSGDASGLGQIFTTRFGETYNHIKISHLIPDQQIDWDIVEHYHANEALSRDDEWQGTRILWRLTPLGSTGTRVDFTHEGLVKSMECWDICEEGWNFFLLKSLKPYLETGAGQPFQHMG